MSEFFLMKKNIEQWKTKWGKSRMKGKQKYVIIYALLFSILSNILWAIIYMLIEGSILNDFVIKEFGTWRIIPRLLFFFLIGLFLAYRAWKKKEKLFNAISAHDKNL